jgi:hypothetical protein
VYETFKTVDSLRGVDDFLTGVADLIGGIAGSLSGIGVFIDEVTRPIGRGARLFARVGDPSPEVADSLAAGR